MSHPQPSDAADLFGDAVVAAELSGAADPSQLPTEEFRLVAHAAPLRQRAFASGRACARAALALLGCGPVVIPAHAGGGPAWPQGFVGSLTHVDGYSLAVVGLRTHWASLGVDAEWASQVTPDLWPNILTPGEFGRLEAAPAGDRQMLAAIAFSAKEAFYKAQHPLTGAWLDFLDAEVAVEGARFDIRPRNGAFDPRLPPRIQGAWLAKGNLIVTGLGLRAPV